MLRRRRCSLSPTALRLKQNTPTGARAFSRPSSIGANARRRVTCWTRFRHSGGRRLSRRIWSRRIPSRQVWGLGAGSELKRKFRLRRRCGGRASGSAPRQVQLQPPVPTTVAQPAPQNVIPMQPAAARFVESRVVEPQPHRTTAYAITSLRRLQRRDLRTRLRFMAAPMRTCARRRSPRRM